MEPIKVYGADWCAMTTRTLAYLDQLRIPYTYINIENDPAGAEWVRQQNGGKEKKPTLDLGGETLTEPTNRELEQALSRLHRIPAH